MATNFLSLRNTVNYNAGGSTISDGSLNITSTNKEWWTTTLAQALNYSSLTGSSMTTNVVTVGSTMTVSSLTASAAVTYSTLSGSTITTNTATVGSTLTVSSLTASAAVTYSTLAGSTIATNFATVGSTLSVSSLAASAAITYSTLSGSTITTNNATVGSTLSVSSLAASAAVTYSTLAGSTIATNFATVGSTLSVSSLAASAAITYSTLAGSTMSSNTATVASTLTGSTITLTGNVGIGTTTPAVILDVYGQTYLARGTTVNRYLEFSADSANVSYIDFHSKDGATGVDYDARILSNGGGGNSVSGGARLDLVGSTITVTGTPGYVGIGTTAPFQQLDVRGNTYVSGTVGIGTTAPFQPLDVRGNTYMSGTVGIGTTVPAYALDVRSGGTPAISLGPTSANKLTIGYATGAGSFATNSATGDIVIRNEDSAKNLILQAGSGAAVVAVGSANVGIGTTTPSVVLDVWSSSTYLSRSAVNRYLEFGSTADSAFIDFHSKDNATGVDYDTRILSSGGGGNGVNGGGQLMLYASTITTSGSPGYVGIGTTVPSALTHIYGQGTSGGLTGLRNNTLTIYGYQPGIYITGSATGGNRSWNMWVGSTAGDAAGLGALNVYDDTAGYLRFSIDTTGGIRFPAYADGTLTISGGNGTLTTSSDIRLKENIVYQTNTPDALQNVLQLKPATFNFIGGYGTYMGFIAQDVEKVIPVAVDAKKYEWVYEMDDNNMPKLDENGQVIYKLDENGQKIIRPRGLDNRAIIATLVLAIQELTSRIMSLNNTVEAQQSTITSQQEQINTILARLTAAGIA